MSKGYYYLVASLPQLRLDDYKEPYRVNEFVGELFEHLTPRHCRYVRDFLYGYDSPHIADALLGKETARPGQPGNWSFAEIKIQMQMPEAERDSYLSSVLSGFHDLKKNKEALPRPEVESLVAAVYYKKMRAHENRLLREYFRFDWRLRNILAALNKRKFPSMGAEFLEIEEDPDIEQLKTSAQNDFGLSREVDYLPGLLEAFGKGDVLHLEKYVDLLRWRQVDDLNLFKYFEIDVLLGYLIKLMLVERWILLDERRGQEVLAVRTEVNESRLYQAH